MGTTPIHGIPFAEPTDLVRDWPALSEDVALAIEAALENIPVTQKKIEAFTGSGTWTVPAGVTYAIAHMLGGGGGSGASGTPGDGGDSSVAFASGTVVGPGQSKSQTIDNGAQNGANNTGQSGGSNVASPTVNNRGALYMSAPHNQYVVAGGDVTPDESITVTVGAGGSAGTGNGAVGGSGYVYIEYYEEV